MHAPAKRGIRPDVSPSCQFGHSVITHALLHFQAALYRHMLMVTIAVLINMKEPELSRIDI